MFGFGYPEATRPLICANAGGSQQITSEEAPQHGALLRIEGRQSKSTALTILSRPSLQGEARRRATMGRMPTVAMMGTAIRLTMALRARTSLPSVEILLRVALWSVLLAVVAYTRTDPDLWGHVRFGLDVLRDGTLPRTDPYSFTSDREWINHEWAAEIAAGAAFRGAGGAGLVILKILVMAGSLLLLDWVLRRDGVLEGRRRDWIGAAAVITTVQQAHHVRPHLFSLLFFTVLLACLVNSSAPTGRRWLWAVPPLFAVWANFHGGWIVGGAVLMLWTLGSAMSARADGSRPVALLVGTGAASLIATLANPYGVGLWRFLWDTVGFGRADITEWQPVYALDPSVWALWIVTTVLAVLGLVREQRAHLEPRRILVVGVLAVGSLLVNRLLGFFALSTLTLFGAALVNSRQSNRATGRVVAGPTDRAAGMAIGFTMMAGALVAFAVNVLCVRIDARTAPEPEAVRVLQSQTGGSRLLVWFDWGEYAIWHLNPRMRVSIDGRRETVYSAELHERHLRFFFDAPAGADLPRELAADYVWIPRQLPAARRLTAYGWTLLYEGERSAIFGRPGTPPPKAPLRPAQSNARCFPSP